MRQNAKRARLKRLGLTPRNKTEMRQLITELTSEDIERLAPLYLKPKP